MTASERVVGICTTIKSMFEIMDDHLTGIHFDVRQELESYHRKLQQQLAVQDSQQPPISGSLEMEFYVLLEHHPRLRDVHRAAINLEVVSQCAKRLGQLQHLARERALTGAEIKEKSSVEEALNVSRPPFEQALDLCKERMRNP